jgi:hypothetical protein
MIDVDVAGQDLKVVLTGSDALLYATKRRWEVAVPLKHVQRARVGRPAGWFVRRHAGGPGHAMICAHRTGATVVIDLDGDPYISMTLWVPDPEDTVATIKGALRLRN